MGILTWLMGSTAGGLIKAGLGLANAGIGYLDRKGDREVEKYKTDAGAVTDLGGEALRVQAARAESQASVVMAAMTHPVFWVMWALFVLPPALYDAAIYFVSVFDRQLNTPGCTIPAIGEAIAHGAHVCEYWVRKVPADQRAARASIIYFIFGAQAISGLSAGLGQAATAWLGKRSAK